MITMIIGGIRADGCDAEYEGEKYHDLTTRTHFLYFFFLFFFLFSLLSSHPDIIKPIITFLLGA